MTPTTVNGSRRAPTGTAEPTTSGLMPKCCRHAAWLSTITRGASASSSPGRNVRPWSARAPSVSKNDAETALIVSRTGGSSWTSTAPHVVDPIAAISAKAPASARQSSKLGSETSMWGLSERSSRSHMTTSSSWSAKGNGRSSTASTTAKRPIPSPRPSASVRIAARPNAG